MPRNLPKNEGPVQPKMPAYRRHKASGQAVVTLSGKDHYLGPYRAAESRERYQEVVGAWLARGRRLAEDDPAPKVVSVNEVLLAYVQHTEGYYVRDGVADEHTLWHIRRAVRAVRECFGMEAVTAFGPKKLAVVRDNLVKAGYCRGSCNRYVRIVRRAFKWASAQELAPASVWQSLASLEGLRRGRTSATEPEPVKPVPLAHVEAVKPFLAGPVRGLVELQQYTGCRPGEAVICRAIDIDVSGKVWLWRPVDHKNKWRGKGRVVAIGPRGQTAIKPFLNRAVDSYLFSPIDTDTEVRATRSAKRITPATYGNRPGTNRRKHPRRKPRDRYTVNTYDHAIRRACEKANVPAWSANRLRHAFGTEARRACGLEAAQQALGHCSAVLTDSCYAERDLAVAVRVAKAIG